jgi:predicted DNA binding protein
LLYDCVLEIDYKIPTVFTKLSSQFPKLNIKYWCNSKIDIIIIEGGNTNQNGFLTVLKKSFTDIEIISSADTDNSVILRVCTCHVDPLDSILESLGCLDIPPIRFFKGKQFHRILMDSVSGETLLEKVSAHESINSVNIKKLAPARISHHLYPVYISLEDLFGNLSKKQLISLISAYQEGYYEIPRKTKAVLLASEMNINRRTYEEHLRKAENRIMSYIIPVLQMMFTKN